MAEINQNYTEQAHEQEYQPENQQELANELAHAQEHEEENHEVEGGIPGNFHPEGEPNPADEQNNADEPNNADEQNNADEPDNADELNYADELNHADEPNNADETNNAQKPVSGSGDRWPGWPGESVFRILVPAQKVGGIIGRKGEYIKKTCEETKARIKILDGPPGMRERAVMISAKEEPDAPLPPAVDGLLRVHKRAVDGLENDSSLPPPVSGGKVSTRLLVPAAQAGSLIGKQGTTVKSIQEESNCVVRILEDLPVFALQDDRIVEVVGEPASTHKAVELIASHLRKFLVDRSIIPIIEMQMQMPNAQMEHMPPPQQWGPPPPQSFPQNGPVGPGYGASPHFMPPPRQFDNYYPPPAEIPPPSEKQPHQGISAYGREAQLPVHSSASQPTSSVITQMTQQMQIPLLYADAVIGTQGSSISYIRRVSGATVTIQETRGVPTEMTVEISGTSSQVQTAQQLIQNFMAEAAASAAPQTQHASSGEQAYSSYAASQGSVYAASQPPSNPAGQTGGGAYGSVYGSNYGY